MFDVILADINGVWRGLQAPAADRDALLRDGVSWPRSLYAMRFDGGVCEETGLGLSAGDPDYPCVFIPETAAPTAWREGGTQAAAEMRTPDGAPFFADPRAVLAAILEKFHAEGLRPILAVELEFYLSGEESAMSELYSPDATARCAEFFDLTRRAAAAQNIALGAAVSEYAPGQFEINLRHGEPLRACLEALLFRRIVRECARAVGRRATFMAKPRGDGAGSGMHLHLSVRAADGGFCFADTQKLHSAVAGILSIVGEATAFFAPFGNSYRRYVGGAYAPLSACWDEENRRAAVRLPRAASPAAARLELRAPGADANPYLAAAALLAGAHYGLANALRPPKPMVSAGRIPATWHAALSVLSRAKILPRYMDAKFLRLYRQIKTDELRRETRHVTDYDRDCYGRVL
ncbi:MAG: glutamine synthetase family protein [Gammaproteobacteria bacterium]